jgi:tRNA(Ile)-lysidine synthase
MAAVPGLRVVRPLLGVTRSETTAYCQARDISWLTDPTNADPRLLRNRVRHHLLPVLRTYNPAIDEALDRLSIVMRDEEAYLREATVRRYADLVRHGSGRSWIDVRLWGTLPVAIQRRIVREIAYYQEIQEIGLDAVGRALAVGTANGPPRAELGGGLIVTRKRGDLIFERLDDRTEGESEP